MVSPHDDVAGADREGDGALGAGDGVEDADDASVSSSGDDSLLPSLADYESSICSSDYDDGFSSDEDDDDDELLVPPSVGYEDSGDEDDADALLARRLHSKLHANGNDPRHAVALDGELCLAVSFLLI